MDITNKPKVTVDEMRQYYVFNFPYLELNNQRLGRFAKKIGYRLTKQMKNRKYIYFYLKEDLTQN